VVAIFRRSTACRRTRRGGALRKFVLLLLEGEDVVDPFQDEEALEKAQAQGAVVERVPVDIIEDGDVWPIMVLAQTGTVQRKKTVASELGGNVVSDGNGANLKAAFASGEEGDGREPVLGGLKNGGCNPIALNVQLDWPGELVFADIVVLMTVNVMKDAETGKQARRDRIWSSRSTSE
jgi:hypothetical protein